MAYPPQPPPAPGNPYQPQQQPYPQQPQAPQQPYQPTPYQPTPYQPVGAGAPANPYADQAPAAPYQAPPAPPVHMPQQGGYGYPQDQPPAQPGYAYQAPVGAPEWTAGPVPVPNGLTCRFCGGYPAVNTTVRGHRGMIILMTFRRLPGPFCKTCGTAAVRDMSASTLVQGWWGYASSVITPITLLINLAAFSKIRNLPEPAPNPPAQPMNPGKPLLQRPQALGFLLPVALVLLLIVALASSSSSDNSGGYSGGSAFGGTSSSSDYTVGSCVQNTGTSDSPSLETVACAVAPGNMQILDKLSDTTSDSGCPQGSTQSFTHEESGNDFVLCLKPYAG